MQDIDEISNNIGNRWVNITNKEIAKNMTNLSTHKIFTDTINTIANIKIKIN